MIQQGASVVGERNHMFGLPPLTVFAAFGIPLIWVIYTLGFLYVSRNWDRDEQVEESGQ
jgi:hypothetical protein